CRKRPVSPAKAISAAPFALGSVWRRAAIASRKRGAWIKETRMTEAQAAVAHQPGGDFTIETIQVEDPRAGEVRVRVTGVGVCHSDRIFRDQLAPGALPGALGHEGAAVLEAVGEGVEGLVIGDEVVIGFSSCGACPRCAEHLPSYCQNFVPLNYAGMRLD